MSIDPLATFDKFLNRPLGCLTVSLFASLFSGVLWFVHEHAARTHPISSKWRAHYSKSHDVVRKYVSTAIDDVCKFLCAVGALLAAVYLGRAFLLSS